MHWLGDPELNSPSDFVAALPMKLLAHPRGPIAYVGHLDLAWLHGFNDPDDPHILDRWHPRIAPFVKAVDTLLQVRPVGLAMDDMNKKYDLSNAQLTNTYAMATEPVEGFAGWPGEKLIWETARPYAYLRTTTDRRIIIRNAIGTKSHEVPGSGIVATVPITPNE